ncbi:MAG: hypothetical protein ACE10E_05325, partial [Acidiferrobacterales bacterium]
RSYALVGSLEMALHDDQITLGGIERHRLLLPQPLIWAVFFVLGYIVYDLIWTLNLACGGG